MPINCSLLQPGHVIQISPADKAIKLFLERQGYFVGQNVRVLTVSEPIASFNPRTGTDEVVLDISVTNGGGRPLVFDVRESEGYISPYFS